MDNNINNNEIPKEATPKISGEPVPPQANTTGQYNQASSPPLADQAVNNVPRQPNSVATPYPQATEPNAPYETQLTPQPPEKKSKGPIIALVIVVIALIVGMVGVSLVSVNNEPPAETPTVTEEIEKAGEKETEKTSEKETPKVEDKEKAVIATAPRSSDAPYTTPEVAEMVTPSVVGVIQYQSSLYDPTGLGSGFIVDKKDNTYYIVTNNHVVESGGVFRIRLHDGIEIDAEVVGVDPQNDLAVLKITSDAELTVSKLGNSDELRVGETVIAIGNPLALDFSGSVTQGIVSAVNRVVETEYKINYIQTDAAINPGNSGGALVNMYSEIIGINTVKVQGTGLEGLGFAIPISEAKPIIEELITYGKVTSRPILGIEGVEIDGATAYRYSVPTGIMIKGINKEAKFEEPPLLDDIITHVEGERINSMADLKSELNKYEIGDKITLTVYREEAISKKDDIKVVVELIGMGID